MTITAEEIPDFATVPVLPAVQAYPSRHVGPPVVGILPGGTAGYRRDRISVRFARDEEVLRRIKGVPGKAWHADLLVWSTPLTSDNCRRLREVFGPALVVDTDLRDWYRSDMLRQQQQDRAVAEKLAAKERERSEQIRLDAERALYGSAMTSPVPPGTGVPGASEGDEAPLVGDPPPRVPLAECTPTDTRWLAPVDPAFADDWRGALQAEGAAWLSANRGGLLADEVGLGKTRTCIMAAIDEGRALAGVHLIVAPLKPARLTWPGEIRRWCPQGVVLEWPLGESSAHAKAMRLRAIEVALAAGQPDAATSRPVFLVVNHDAMRRYPALLDVTWASVIVDEAHEALSTGNRGPRRSTRVAAALRRVQVDEAEGMRVACTGTPFAGRLANLWGCLDFLAPDRHGSRGEFAGGYTAPAGDVGSGATLDRVAPGRESAWGRLMQGWVLRRTRTAAQRAMLQRRVEIVQPTPLQREQDEAWRQRQVWTGTHVTTADAEAVETPSGGTVMRSTATGAVLPDVIGAVTRRVQLAVGAMEGISDEDILAGTKARYTGPGDSGKVLHLERLLGEWGMLDLEWWHLAGEEGKVIVASPWTSGLDLVAEMLTNHLPASSWVRIDGSSSPRSLEHARDSFCAPRGPGILLLSSTAGGAGLTLDQHCTRLVILSEDWVQDTQSQVEGRIANRTWQTHREIVTLRSEGMLDGYLGARAEHQDHVQTSLLELASAC